MEPASPLAVEPTEILMFPPFPWVAAPVVKYILPEFPPSLFVAPVDNIIRPESISSRLPEVEPVKKCIAPEPAPVPSELPVFSVIPPETPESEVPEVTLTAPPSNAESASFPPAVRDISEPVPLLLAPTDRDIAPAFPLEDWPVVTLMSPLRPPEEARVLAPVLMIMVPESEPEAALVTAPVVTLIAPEPFAVALLAAAVLMVTLPLSPDADVPEVNARFPPLWLVTVAAVLPAERVMSPPTPLVEAPTAMEIPPAVPHEAAPVAIKISPVVPNLEDAAPVESTKIPEVEESVPEVAPVATVIAPVAPLSPSVLAVRTEMVPEAPEFESPEVIATDPPVLLVVAVLDPATKAILAPNPLAELPTDKEIDPACPAGAAPVATNTSPLFPDATELVPVLSVRSPESEPLVPALEGPVATVTEPLPVDAGEADAPDLMETLPDESVVAVPEVKVTTPPAPSVLDPAVAVNAPPRPLTPEPTPIVILPA